LVEVRIGNGFSRTAVSPLLSAPRNRRVTAKHVSGGFDV
jgi:hypothetical protein